MFFQWMNKFQRGKTFSKKDESFYFKGVSVIQRIKNPYLGKNKHNSVKKIDFLRIKINEKQI